MAIKEILYDWNGYNTAIFYAINALHTVGYDHFMTIGTMFGKFLLFPVYMALIIGFAYIGLVRIKDSNSQDYIIRRNRWISVITVLVIAYLVQLVWIGALKHFLHYPRPFIALPEGTVVKLSNEDPNASFPSGHSAFAMLMATGLWPVLNRYGKIIAVSYVALIGLSRIALGMHFPADVLIAFIFSFLNVWLVRQITEGYILKRYALVSTTPPPPARHR